MEILEKYTNFRSNAFWIIFYYGHKGTQNN